MSTEERDDARIYEVGYLIVPTVPEERLGAEVTALKDILDRAKAIVISEEFPKMTNLAYAIRKAVAGKYHRFNTGYFGWIKFEVDAESAPAIDKELEKGENLLRYLLIKTARENTMSPKSFMPKGDRALAPKREVKKEDAVPVSEVELEKSIEKLITE